jgi:hypothetical protein
MGKLWLEASLSQKVRNLTQKIKTKAKGARDAAQLVEHLPHKLKVLSSFNSFFYLTNFQGILFS